MLTFEVKYMPRPVNYLLVVLLAFAGSSAFGQTSKAASDMPATIGEMVRLEAAKALAETRKTAGLVDTPVQQSSLYTPKKSTEVINTDRIELLGTYKRSEKFSADLSINGVVSFVEAGEKIGSYEVKGIGGNCLYLLDATRKEILRCVSGAAK
jgi:hypothetical protein